MAIYRGSDGEYYTDRDIWNRLEDRVWRVCCWDVRTGMEVIETEEGDLLFLAPYALRTRR